MTQELKNQNTTAGESATSAELGLPGVEGGSWEWKYNDLRKRMENYLLREIDTLEVQIREAKRMGNDYGWNEYVTRQGDLKAAQSYFYAVTQAKKLEQYETEIQVIENEVKP